MASTSKAHISNPKGKPERERYGIVSILRNLSPSRMPTFDDYYNALGANSGNLLFTNAVWRQLEGDKVRLNFKVDPAKANDKYSAIIFPAANWIHTDVDFTPIAQSVEQLTIPVTIIGLGAQAPDYTSEQTVSDGMTKFLKAISERSHSLSVRGEYSKSVLNGLDIDNVTVTGCPSLYCDFKPFKKPVRPSLDPAKVLLHATRYAAKHLAGKDQTNDTNRKLYNFAYTNRMDLLYQSELEEMKILSGYHQWIDLSKSETSDLRTIYGARSDDNLQNFITHHGKLYTNIGKWSRSLDQYSYVIGTRLHGTIMALNSGIPATLITHDSRTQEMAEFARIPFIKASDMDISAAGIKHAFESADFDAYYARREENRAVYREFLLNNKINPSF